MRLKWTVDGRRNWDEYQNVVVHELEGWRGSVEGLKEGESVVEQVWLDWKERVTRAAEKGIGKKKLGKAQRTGDTQKWRRLLKQGKKYARS